MEVDWVSRGKMTSLMALQFHFSRFVAGKQKCIISLSDRLFGIKCWPDRVRPETGEKKKQVVGIGAFCWDGMQNWKLFATLRCSVRIVVQKVSRRLQRQGS